MELKSKIKTMHLELGTSPSKLRASRYNSLRKEQNFSFSKTDKKCVNSAYLQKQKIKGMLFEAANRNGHQHYSSKHRSIVNFPERVMEINGENDFSPKNSIHGRKKQIQRFIFSSQKTKEMNIEERQLLIEPKLEDNEDIEKENQQKSDKADKKNQFLQKILHSSTPPMEICQNYSTIIKAGSSIYINSTFNIADEEKSPNQRQTPISTSVSKLFPRKKVFSVDQSSTSKQNLQLHKQSSINSMNNSNKSTINNNNNNINNKLPKITQKNQKNPSSMMNQPKSPLLKQKRQNKNIPMLPRDPEQLKNIKADSFSVLEYPSETLILTHKGINNFEIASLTKVMTFYCVRKIEERYGLNIENQKVTITDHATDMSGTSAELHTGEIYGVKDLLYGLMLPSGNDAAVALALWGGKQILSRQQYSSGEQGYIKNISCNKLKFFIEEMNSQAKKLQLLNTKFANPHGLPHPQAKSTSIEVARLCATCLKDPLFTEVIKTRSYKCEVSRVKSNSKRLTQWTNTNKLLRRDNFLGIKTGITVTAGPCLASAYEFRNKIYIVVILRGNKVSRRFKQTRRILYWCLSRLYRDNLNNAERLTLQKLRNDDPDLDSDYSEDEREFNYNLDTKEQYKKRCSIIRHEM